MAVTSDDPPGMGRMLVRGEERKRIGKKKKTGSSSFFEGFRGGSLILEKKK
jgi:hypothetical protein